MPTLSKSKIEKTYARFLWIFLALAVATIFFILYFSFSKTKIFVTPTVEPYSTDITLFIGENEATSTASRHTVFTSGQLMSVQVSGEESEDNLADSGETSKKATGEATIYNTLATGQSLVQNTRLLSANGILYRTQERIFVPSQGRVRVGIIADQEGETQVIDASRFTLPGLPSHLQSSIYAETTSTTHTQSKIVTKNDIVALKTKLLQELSTQATEELLRQAQTSYPDLDLFSDATHVTILDFSTNAEANEQVNSLHMNMKIELTTVIGDQDELFRLSQEALQNTIPEHMKLISNQPPNVELHLNDVDLEKKTATLVASITGSSVIALSHPAFDRTKLLNKDRQQIRVYFDQFPEIASVEVLFSPFWVTKAPPLVDHVEIIVRPL